MNEAQRLNRVIATTDLCSAALAWSQATDIQETHDARLWLLNAALNYRRACDGTELLDLSAFAMPDLIPDHLKDM